MSKGESFLVKLPAHIARRVTFYAAEREITVEQYIAEAAVGYANSDFTDSFGKEADEGGDKAEALKLNSASRGKGVAA